MKSELAVLSCPDLGLGMRTVGCVIVLIEVVCAIKLLTCQGLIRLRATNESLSAETSDQAMYIRFRVVPTLLLMQTTISAIRDQ